MGIFLADAPVGHEPNPKTHFLLNAWMQKVFFFLFWFCVVLKIGDEVHTEAAVGGGGGCVAAAGGPEVGRQRRDGHTMETLAANRTSRLRWLKTVPRGTAAWTLPARTNTLLYHLCVPSFAAI